ncbi:D-alanyl-D-alanine carboxypeptidase family protein [Hazenella coriacea]|uniref:serine-type D-Ala-D-Ala carboxypeptidase n=1 Tax=Hazenella coriacea TaxID=1179467 RepID=A0A4R3L6G7_9BACL|nr:D-alanyl-D-alanine carboxypeptidase family protein [Hazenella coriacea]TCS95471.1 D-alanyl-D-alanine carboxypeptidase (penicillin-binding protein 5/6) [Hazenella coriacea]
MKRTRSTWTSKLLSLIIFCLMFLPGRAWAEESKLEINAKSYIVMDFESGAILEEKQMDEARPPASMTKMMSEFVVLDLIKEGKLKWEDQVTVSPRAAAIQEASIGLRAGEKETVKELFIAMAVQSANDATVVLAEHIGESEEKFVDMMNQKAKELGMNHTHYCYSTGLEKHLYPDPPQCDGKHVMSARDSAILAKELMKEHPDVLEITSIPNYTFGKGTSREMKVPNWNFMLPGSQVEYDGVDGVKTGYTDAAGYCFTGTAQRGSYRLVTVVMGTNSQINRFKETAKLLDYGFQEFEFQNLVPENKPIPKYEELSLPNGVEREVPVVAKTNVQLPTHKNEQDQYEIKVTYKPNLQAPINAGTVVGEAQVLYKGKEIPGMEPVEVITQTDIEEGSWFRLFFRDVGDTISDWFE